MKHSPFTALLLAALTVTARAAIVVPGANGSDGALNVTTNTVIDLSRAVTGNWDTNNAAHAGQGVYDPSKWAVVFKYTDVTIAEGAMLTFTNHPSRAPVVWLVQGDVTIHSNAVVSLNGQDGQLPPGLAEPGPGGFRGGSGIYSSGVAGVSGFGPGGGPNAEVVAGGNYASIQGGAGDRSSVYGNPSLLPLLGGSGGAGEPRGVSSSGSGYGGGGGGGGGAILIAAANALVFHGSITANGAAGIDGRYTLPGGGGSGGGIRLIADNLVGNGSIAAVGGPWGNPNDPWRGGGVGRIRIERVSNNNSLTVIPDPSVIDLPAGATALLWPPVGAPEVRIVSIGASNAPADPRAAFGTIGADVVLPLVNTTPVIVETTNVEQASQVTVRGMPRSNGNYIEVVAAVDSVVSDDPLVVRWKADLPVNAGYSAVQVKVVRP